MDRAEVVLLSAMIGAIVGVAMREIEAARERRKQDKEKTA